MKQIKRVAAGFAALIALCGAIAPTTASALESIDANTTRRYLL